MTQQEQTILLAGGLDMISPGIQVKPGFVIACENYECDVEGYRRIDGYERFNGGPKPSESTPQQLAFDAGSTEPNVGDKITGATSGAYGYLQEAATVSSGDWGTSDAAGVFILRNITGTFQNNENLQVSAVTHAVANGTLDPDFAETDEDLENYKATARTQARSAISAVTGSGDILGVCTYNGDVYAFRNNAGGTAAVMFKATESGWSAQSFGHTLDFTSGSSPGFAEAETITGGTSGATATVKRVVRTSGAWSGTAAGYLVLASITGTFQAAETITGGTSSTTATASAAQAAITLPAGGKYRTVVHNFYGASNLTRLYGVNGVGYAFEWDGTVFTPIRTGVATALDKPKFIGVQRNHLFLGYDGGSLQHSGTGLPLSFDANDGAGEVGFGRDLTGLESSTKDSLIITGRNKIGYLTGNDSTDFVLADLSQDSGAKTDTLQVIGVPIFMDDLGMRDLQAAQEFGNWKMGAKSSLIEPLLRYYDDSGVSIVGSTRVRRKNQYLLFYSDGSGISAYFGRKSPEFMRFNLEFTPTCLHSGENSDGAEVLYAGADDGMVYQLNSGPSADGAQITAFFRMAFMHQGAPYLVKRYHRAIIEARGDSAQTSVGLISDYNYGDPDHPNAAETTQTVYGAGGFWDSDYWDQFYWSAITQSTVLFDLHGIGQNLSLVIASDGTETNPHILHSVIVRFTPRRQIK